MRTITSRYTSLLHLAVPLALTFLGVILLSLGVAYVFIQLYHNGTQFPPLIRLLTLQFLPRLTRSLLLIPLGLVVLTLGIWRLSGVVVIPRHQGGSELEDDLVLGYRHESPPNITVFSGGPGLLILSAMGDRVRRLTCVVPVQDPVEYYYRASGLFHLQHVYFVVPTPEPLTVLAELDDGTHIDVRHLAFDQSIASRHVCRLHLEGTTDQPPQLTRLAVEAIRDADAIVFGPGSLFESILPNLLLPELREAIKQSKARKIYVCNLMTEPGRTTGFGVTEHIRAIKTFGGFTPDYVLVNAQRIDTEVYQLYAAANQSPVNLTPEEYEETAMLPTDSGVGRGVMVEGSVVIEADLASSVIQYTASLTNPSENRAARVLRHDSEKLSLAILELLRRS